jgi:hypothetical protein
MGTPGPKRCGNTSTPYLLTLKDFTEEGYIAELYSTLPITIIPLLFL